MFAPFDNYTMPRRNRRVNRNTIIRRKIWSVLWRIVVCAAVLSFLAIDGYKFAPRFRYWWRNRQIKQGYVREIEKLKREQNRLREEMGRLADNPLTQERLAREMGYIKPGETVYKIVQKTKAASDLD